MKLVRLSIPDQIDAWEALESTEGVTIEGVYRFDSCVIVKYTILEERMDHEFENLSRIKEIAARLENDRVLPTLKNARQRELYFLDVHNVDSKTGSDVWEYLKMREKMKEGSS